MNAEQVLLENNVESILSGRIRRVRAGIVFDS